MAKIFKVYTRLLQTYPLLSQAVQTGLLMAGGDLMCQKLVEDTKKINWARTAKFTAVGFFYIGPLLRRWFGLLNIHVGQVGRTVALKKMVLDQFMFAPVYVASLLTMFNALEGLSLEDNWKKLKHDYPDIMITNYCLWPAVQLMNFTFVPLNYQVLVNQSVCLFWNIYLSWKVHRDVK